MTSDPNLRVQVDPDRKVLDVRQSAIQAYLNCPRRFFWEYVQGLEPDYTGPRPWTAANIGTAVHEMLGAYYRGEDPEAALVSWLDETFGGVPPDADLDLVRIMVAGHIEDLAETGADAGETTIAVEAPVIAPVTDIGDGWTVRVHGRVDRLIETDDGFRIIDDWKTVSSLTGGGALQHIQQLGRYAAMIRQETGWRADRVRVTEIRKVKRTKEGPFFARPWVPLNEDAYRSHARQLRLVLAEIVDHVLRIADDPEAWLYNVTTECDWKCRVKDICLAQQHGDDPEEIVHLHYRLKGET